MGQGWGDSRHKSADTHAQIAEHRDAGLSVPPHPRPRSHSLMHAPKGKLPLGPPHPGPPCSHSPVSQMRFSIPVSHIRAVERVDEGAFQLPHVMQVMAQDGAGALRTTYLQCKVRHRKDGDGGCPLGPPPPLTAPPPAPTPCRM